MKKFLALVIALVLVVSSFGLGAYAATNYEPISALISHCTPVTYNGVVQEFKDVNGKTVYPILYEGTTYLPVRGVCNMLGISVNYDAATGTVVLGGGGVAPMQPVQPTAVTAESLVNNAFSNGADSRTMGIDINVSGTYPIEGVSVPVTLIGDITIEMDGDVSCTKQGLSLTINNQFDVRHSTSYTKSSNGVTSTWEANNNGAYTLTGSEPAIRGNSGWTASDFTGLTMNKYGDSYYVTGKATTALLGRMGISKLIGAATGTSAYSGSMTADFVFDATTNRLTSATFTAQNEGNITYAKVRYEVSKYGSTVVALPAQLQ